VKVDRKVNVPLYMQVYEALLNGIKDGSYRSGVLLPSERELSALFNVDRLTVRRSLEMLVNEGLIEKKPGLGSWVRSLPPRLSGSVKSGNIVFVLPRSVSRIDRITEPCISSLFYRIEKELARQDFQLIYTTVAEDEELPALVLDPQVVGILFVSQVPRRILDKARELDLPVVVVNYDDDYFPSILPDRENGSYEAVSHLIELGHRRIAFISGIPSYSSSRSNYQGYKHALVDADLDWKSQSAREGDWTFDGGFRAMKSILEDGEELPTAVFACNDMTALGAIEAVREAEFRVPEDVSVVGFDNVEQGSQSNPRLTTVNMDTDLMAKAACQKLVFTIESRQVHSVKIIVPAKLIVRESTARARESGRGEVVSGED
jgi:DNA-binding LacI/PurR family transcriptional regulator